MKRLFNFNKKAVAVGASVGLALGLSGMAIAYWTTGGDGSGSATGGVPTSNLTIDASVATALIPAGDPEAVVLHVTNPNVYSVDLAGDTASIVPGSIECAGTSVSDTWFTLAGNPIGGTTVVAAHGSNVSVSDSGLTLAMNDDPANDQDVCQGAAVTFSLHVVSETTH